jgi:two-component system sensor histidine kinase DegS
VNNILKHSAATHVSVELENKEGNLKIEIRDDGKGFDQDAVTRHQGPEAGFGLQGMRERIDILGGKMEIRTAPGAGTIINIVIPVSEVSSPLLTDDTEFQKQEELYD